MNIQELVAEAYETSKSKGWHDPEIDASVGDRIALCHSELSEALEEARKHKDLTRIYVVVDGSEFLWEPGSKGKPEGFPIELADVLIRIGDMCGKHGIDLERAVTRETYLNLDKDAFKTGETVGECIAMCHLDLSRAFDASLRLEKGQEVAFSTVLVMRMAQCVIRIRAICGKYGIDLDEALRIKMDYNKTRPHRHGGKLF